MGKRKNKRRPITATALIRSLERETPDHPFNGLVMNISRGGAEFSATQSLKPAESFEAVLWFIDSKGVITGGETVKGVVRWEKKMAPFYMFGAEFSEFNEEDQRELLAYLKTEEDD